MPANKNSRSVPRVRRYLATVALCALLLTLLGGMFSTSATRNEKGRAFNSSSRLAATTSPSYFRPGLAPPGSPLWAPVDEASIPTAGIRALVPAKYRTVRLNQDVLTELLAKAPLEFTSAARENPPIITLPMPDGKLARFSFEQSPVVERGLAEKYPGLDQTYRGQGIDDPTATLRFDWLPTGFHAMVLAPSGTVLIDPYASGDQANYITYWKGDAANTAEPFECHFIADPELSSLPSGDVATPSMTSGTTLRTYRLALAATHEYTVAVGSNTIAGALAAEVLIMNRVNGVYERDLAIHMNIVANNNLITFAGDNLGCAGVACTNANDPYSNGSGSTMLGQNTTTLNNVIGTANYDIGHVFSTGGGGVATLNGPCAGNKARGVTGLGNPVGDAFAIDYVAHEMGHQWGANHTFNGTDGSCSGNRSQNSAYEPGSGITIMAYAGICDGQDLAAHSIDTFHVKSLEAMVAYSQTGNGNNCAAPTATNNIAPAVTGPGNFTIPKGTPFSLTAAATDPNGDAITYDWEEYDLDASGAGTVGVPNTDSDGSARAIFVPYLPTVGGTRTFPSLTYVLNNANVPPATTGGFLTGELLPAISRTMNFQVVARDNRANGGGINTATSTVTVDGVSGPFAVTAPNTGVNVAVQSALNVTWNVAGTTAAPVSATNVKISLSTDGGNTFPNVLLATTPNDGSQAVFVPSLPTTTARIKIEGVGNIFFDISNTNFTISAPTAAPASISGRITTSDGAPLAGVTMILSGARSARAVTDSQGSYRFASVDTNNFYTVTPALVNYHFNPAERSFSLLANKTDAVFTATRGAVGGVNAIDDAGYFVRQHYLDFLGREPDESGFNFWSDQILSCGADADCIERRTINVSAAYFLSVEFQETGGLVDGLYRASYGRRPQYAEFMPDTATVARDVVVGVPGWAQTLEADKQAFIDAWVERPAFRAAYDGLANNAFVDTLISHTGASFNGDRGALVSGLNNGTMTRAVILRQVVENAGFISAKRNAAFVMMQYFGYLRRDPDESGYAFWLNKLSEFNGNFERAEMVKAFLVSGEYRQRFGQ